MDGTTFQIDVAVDAAGVAPAADALETMTDRLAGVGDVSDASYAKAEAAANRAALAVERVGLKADAQRGKLAAALDAGDDAGAARAVSALERLTDKQAQATSKAVAAKSALDAQAVALDAVKSAAEQAAGGTEELGEAGERGNGSLTGLSRGLRKIGGPLAELSEGAIAAAEGFEKLEASIGAMAGPLVAAAAVLILVAAFVELGKKIVETTYEIAKWGVELAEAGAKNELLAAGIARSVAGGKKLNDQIAQLQNRVPQTREELSTMAETLAKTGLRGDALAAALEKAAIKAAKLKFGPDFEKEMLSAEQQSARFSRNIAGTFGGLKIEKLEEAFATLVNLFDSTTVTGHAMKVVFESIFQPLIDGLEAFIPKMVSAFIQFEILVLKALIFIKPFGSKILWVAEACAIVAAVVVGVLVAAFVLLGSIVAVASSVVVGIGYAFVKLTEAAYAVASAIVDAVGGAFNWLASLSLADIGANMIKGLIDGIMSAGGALLSAVTGVVTGAIGAAKHALGIASPSTVFAEIGVQTAAGMQQGIESASPGVHGALENMAAPPAPASPAAPVPSASSGGANLPGATFNFYGVQGAEDAQSRFSEMLTRALEGDAAQLGTQSPAGAT